MEVAAKRPAPGLATERIEALRKKLAELYSGRGPDFLWDPTKIWELVHPTASLEGDGQTFYKYVGREGGRTAMNTIRNLRSTQHLQVLGAKGTGKSTVLSTITGYLIGSGEKKVVYLCGTQLVVDPVFILLQAFFVACGITDSLLKLAALEPTVDQLVVWVRSQPRGSLLFVVDDWDIFEAQPNTKLEKVIYRTCMTHALVKVSSVNGRNRHIWSDSDKVDDEIATIFFDGPYTSRELDTWLGQSGLTAEQLQHVDRLTGGTPGLLRVYEEGGGDETKFLGRIRGLYTSKLFDRFICKLETQKQLRAAMDLVLSGQLSYLLLGPDVTDFTCFYMDVVEELFYPLSPYLRSQAEYFVMEQHANLQSTLVYNDILSWVQAVALDCTCSGRNPARIGWKVEGLVISVIRYQKQVFGKPFKHYRRYAHGAEMAALKSLTELELGEGVLLGPIAFNKKAVDLLHMVWWTRWTRSLQCRSPSLSGKQRPRRSLISSGGTRFCQTGSLETVGRRRSSATSCPRKSG